MSTLIMGLCWPLQMCPTQKSVLMSLADNANDQCICWPSIQYICMRTCFKRTSVMNALQKLEESGRIECMKSPGRTTTYKIHIADLLKHHEQVRKTDPSGKRTGPRGKQHQSGKRVRPVRQTDPNRKEPSISATTTPRRSPLDDIPPSILHGLQQDAIEVVVEAIRSSGLEADQQKHILLEVLAGLRNGTVRAPGGLVLSLVERTRAGTFRRSAGLTLESDIARLAAVELSETKEREKKAAKAARRADPEYQERSRLAAESAIDEMGKFFHRSSHDLHSS